MSYRLSKVPKTSPGTSNQWCIICTCGRAWIEPWPMNIINVAPCCRNIPKELLEKRKFLYELNKYK